MYIQNKPAAAFYKLFLGAFALILEWFLLSHYGLTALRLFPTWVLFLTATYFLSSSLVLTFSAHKFTGKNLCPPLEGMIIMSLALMGAVAFASHKYGFYLPELSPWLTWSLGLILPVLTLLDWLLFVKKGRWHLMMPFYGLALPVSYLATMVFTAEMLPDATDLLYSLELINLREFGLWPALQYLAVGAVVLLIFGYMLYIVDFTMSGKLAKHVVLPHIRIINVDENGAEITVPEQAIKVEQPATAKPSAADIKPSKGPHQDKEPRQNKESHQSKPSNSSKKSQNKS